MWANHKDELTADFQQYYGLDVDELGHGLRPLRAAVLAAQLPASSRTMRAIAGVREWWSPEAWLLWSLEYCVRSLASAGPVNPMPNPLSAREPEKMDADALADALGIPVEMR